MSVVDDAIGRREDALAIDGSHPGPISSEVEELAGLRQPPQLPRPEMTLQDVQRKRSYLPHVNPGSEHGDGYGPIQFRQGFAKFKFTYSHTLIVPKIQSFRNPVTELSLVEN